MLEEAFERMRLACHHAVSRCRGCCRCCNPSRRQVQASTSDLCGWLSSLLFWDWLPVGQGDMGSQDGEMTSGRGVTTERGGDGRRDGQGVQRTGRDTVKPLLRKSPSFEFREKEKKFVKGEFVMPGSEVQKRIADAMAGVLAAGRAVTSRSTSGRTVAGRGYYHDQVHNDDCSNSSRGSHVSIEEEHEAKKEKKYHGGQYRRSSSRPGLQETSQASSSSLAAREAGKRNRGSTSKVADDESTHSAAVIDLSEGSGGKSMSGDPGEDSGVDRADDPRGWAVRAAPDGRECVICMEDFTESDPEMLTLCSCGMNKTFFHYTCLLEWLGRHSYCPACRGYLYFEERSVEGRPARDTSGRSKETRASLDSEAYRAAFQNALRAGLDARPRNS